MVSLAQEEANAMEAKAAALQALQEEATVAAAAAEEAAALRGRAAKLTATLAMKSAGLSATQPSGQSAAAGPNTQLLRTVDALGNEIDEADAALNSAESTAGELGRLQRKEEDGVLTLERELQARGGGGSFGGRATRRPHRVGCGRIGVPSVGPPERRARPPQGRREEMLRAQMKTSKRSELQAERSKLSAEGARYAKEIGEADAKARRLEDDQRSAEGERDAARSACKQREEMGDKVVRSLKYDLDKARARADGPPGLPQSARSALSALSALCPCSLPGVTLPSCCRRLGCTARPSPSLRPAARQ